MEAFEKEFPRLLAHMLAHEAPMDNSPQLKCPCGNSESEFGDLYRCQDCFIDGLHCTKCIINSHADHPLHWIERWTGDHFEKELLSSIGFVLYLGHDGIKCLHTPKDEEPLPFTVVHNNGIHNLGIAWCFCAGCGNHVDQLMLAGLFPATVIDPRTAFTFSVLREFTVHKLQSKKAAYDYFTSLRRLTNGAFTYDTPVCAFLAFLLDMYKLFMFYFEGLLQRVPSCCSDMAASCAPKTSRRSLQFTRRDAACPQRLSGNHLLRMLAGRIQQSC